MPTPVAHALAGVALYLGATRKASREDWSFAGALVVAAWFPDLDFGLGFLTGVNYHHYFTHSIGFTLLFTAITYIWARKVRVSPFRYSLWVGFAYASHLCLDLFSKDKAAPYGLELFWPLSDRFFMSSLTVFDNICRGTLAKLFGLNNWLAVRREVLILGPIVLGLWWWSRRRNTYTH